MIVQNLKGPPIPSSQIELQIALTQDPDSVILDQKNWGKFEKYLPDVTDWTILKLWVFGLHDPQVINKLLPVNFHNLIWLSITENNIETIETLTYLKAPQLKGIYANSNHIHSMRAVSRVNAVWETLALSRNPIAEITDLSRCDFGNVMGCLELQLYSGMGVEWVDISPLIKCTFGHFKTIRLNHDKFYRALTKHLMEKKIQPQGRNNFRRGHWNPPRNNHR